MIPKIIHYCWLGGKPLTPLAEKCIASWRRVMPDYEIKRWDESNYNFQKNKFMAAAYQQKKWGFVPDYARLDIIYNYGGIYFDTDVETLKPFDEFLKYPAFCGFESEHFINFGHGFGAEKGNKVIKQLMEPYENMNFNLDDNIIKLGTLYTKIDIRDWCNRGLALSPFVQSNWLVNKFSLEQNNTRQSLDGMEVFPSSYFCPKGKDNLPSKTNSAYSVHWFAGSWLPWYDKLYNRLKGILRKVLGNKYASLVRVKKKLFK